MTAIDPYYNTIIPTKLYKRTVSVLPILCVDVVIYSDSGILLVKRANEPLAGQWWVIGGRVLKGEDLKEAAQRKVLEEVGIRINKDSLRPIGYYGDIFYKNPLGVETGLHTVSMVFECEYPVTDSIKLDSQSTDYKWSKRLPLRLAERLVRC